MFECNECKRSVVGQYMKARALNEFVTHIKWKILLFYWKKRTFQYDMEENGGKQ